MSASDTACVGIDWTMVTNEEQMLFFVESMFHRAAVCHAHKMLKVFRYGDTNRSEVNSNEQRACRQAL